jgi:hypothetical protein
MSLPLVSSSTVILVPLSKLKPPHCYKAPHAHDTFNRLLEYGKRQLGRNCAADNNRRKFSGKCRTEKHTRANLTNVA